MSDLTTTGGQAATMTSDELLELINEARAEFGQAPIRRNKLAEKIEDELDGEHYTKRVVRNLNSTESAVFDLSRDQCLLISMRESKAVRRRVIEKINQLEGQQRPMTQAELIAASANVLVNIERRQAEQQALLVQAEGRLDAHERLLKDMSHSQVWDHCPQNCLSLTGIKAVMNERYGLSGSVVDFVLKSWPHQPNPAGMVRNGHEDAKGSQYLVWSKTMATAAFRRFVDECEMVTATQATHPYLEGRFKLARKSHP